MALEPARFGLSVPPAAAGEVDPDVILVPLAGFDRRGHRLGYGAGHYDRALARLIAARPRLVLGLAYAAQAVDAVPAEPHDRRLDAVLTETGRIDCTGETTA
jgi:5-formyltetrahydrofolate cyclo-ligase